MILIFFMLALSCSAQALQSDGNVTNFIQSAAMGSLMQGTNFSAMGWIKSTDTDGEIINNFENNGAFVGFSVAVGVTATNNNDLAFYTSEASGSAFTYSGVNVADGTWHHVTVTYDGVNARFYRDTALIETLPRTNKIGASTNYISLFKANNSPASRGLAGTLQGWRIYNIVLSQDDITEDYLRIGRTPPKLDNEVFSLWGSFSHEGNIPAGAVMRDLSVYQAATTTSGTIASVEGILLPPIGGAY